MAHAATGRVEFGAIPDIPGNRAPPQFEQQARRHVATLLNLNHERFPGSQPVSFTLDSLTALQEEDYFVCEKTDGQRCMLLALDNAHVKGCFLIDRKNEYRHVPNLFIPKCNDPTFTRMQNDTLLDGELVLDVDAEGRAILRYLAFDLLVISGTNFMQRSFQSRLGYMDNDVIRPYNRMLRSRPDLAATVPFALELKDMKAAYHSEWVLKEAIPRLLHKSDGLMFTSRTAGYLPGSCEKILKWKPLHENSIDLKLHLAPPASGMSGGRPNVELLVWESGNQHSFYATLGLTEDDWQKWGPQLRDGRIAEVVYDPEHCPPHQWRLLRFRDDKTTANHISVAEKIMRSIRDGVGEDTLFSIMPQVRTAWQAREQQQKQQQPPQ